jgi:hypothetical protein
VNHQRVQIYAAKLGTKRQVHANLGKRSKLWKKEGNLGKKEKELE